MLTDQELRQIEGRALRHGCLDCLRLVAEVERRRGIVASATASLRDVNTFLDLTDSLSRDGIVTLPPPTAGPPTP